jgi:hypothetical protein
MEPLFMRIYFLANVVADSLLRSAALRCLEYAHHASHGDAATEIRERETEFSFHHTLTESADRPQMDLPEAKARSCSN